MHDISDLEPVASEILKLAGTIRVVFATYWAHTRFKEVCIDLWVGMVFDRCRKDAGGAIIQRKCGGLVGIDG
jgi:predicted TIM-barrel fold metal-dependent hydrolase